MQQGELGSVWGHFGVTLRSLWYTRVTWCHFGITLGSLRYRVGSMKLRLQKTHTFPTEVNDFIKHWGEFGVTLGALLAYEGDFGATLGLLCGHFGATLGILASNGT